MTECRASTSGYLHLLSSKTRASENLGPIRRRQRRAHLVTFAVCSPGRCNHMWCGKLYPVVNRPVSRPSILWCRGI